MKKQTTYQDPETGEVYEGYPLMELAKDVLSNPVASLFVVAYLFALTALVGWLL